MKEMACILCGKRPGVSGGLCAGCLSERRRFIELPQFTELRTCAHCGSVVVGKRWTDSRGLEREVEAAAKRAAKVRAVEGAEANLEVEVRLLNDNNADADVTARILFGKELASQTCRTRVRIRRTVCERCSKIHGRYYEAVLQVRSAGRKLSEGELEEVSAIVHGLASEKRTRQEFLAREERMDGGLDYQLGTVGRAKSIAKMLADRYGGRITESSKLAGAKLGKELHRVTFLVRLPALKDGEFVRLDDRVLLITHVGPQGTSATALATGEPVLLCGDDEERAKRLGGPELAEEAVVLEARRPEVQVMDPASYRPVHIVAPGWFWKKKRLPEIVRIVRSGEDLYLVPD